MSKVYKVTHLEFNKRNPNRRKRKSPSLKTRIHIGGRLLKPGAHMYLTVDSYKKGKADIEKYIKAGRIRVTGGSGRKPVKIATPVLENNTKKIAEKPSVKEAVKVEVKETAKVEVKETPPPKVSVKKETPKKAESAKVEPKRPVFVSKPPALAKKGESTPMRSTRRRSKKSSEDK